MRLTYRPEALKRLVHDKYKELCFCSSPDERAFALMQERRDALWEILKGIRFDHATTKEDIVSILAKESDFTLDGAVTLTETGFGQTTENDYSLVRFTPTKEELEKYGEIERLPVDVTDELNFKFTATYSFRVLLAPVKVEYDVWRAHLKEVYESIENTLAESVELNDDEVYALRKLGIKL